MKITEVKLDPPIPLDLLDREILKDFRLGLHEFQPEEEILVIDNFPDEPEMQGIIYEGKGQKAIFLPLRDYERRMEHFAMYYLVEDSSVKEGGEINPVSMYIEVARRAGIHNNNLFSNSFYFVKVGHRFVPYRSDGLPMDEVFSAHMTLFDGLSFNSYKIKDVLLTDYPLATVNSTSR